MYLSKFRLYSQAYHEYIHLFFGLISFFITLGLTGSHQVFFIFALSLLFTYFPDLDHLFFVFVYGRGTKYSQDIRHFLSLRQLNNCLHYCRSNHKNNQFILSHNLFSFGLSFFVATLAHLFHHDFILASALAVFFHFLFDIIEDYLFLGRLNPNWLLQFSKKSL